MEMSQIFNIVAVFIVGFYVTRWFLNSAGEKVSQRLTDEAVNKIVDDIIIRVEIEKHGDIYYLFQENNGNFIAQGKNMDEIKAVCDERFPNKIVVADKEQLRYHNLESSIQ